jgi:hypothetical protein
MSFGVLGSLIRHEGWTGRRPCREFQARSLAAAATKVPAPAEIRLLPDAQGRALPRISEHKAEEEPMYPYLLQSMAVERVKNLRQNATGAARVRHTRRVRAGTRFGIAASSAGAWLARRVVHP